MANNNRQQLARRLYEAFTAGDRTFIEQLLSDDFIFSSPLDVGLDRAEYFKRCWPGAGKGGAFDFLRLVEIPGNEVLVTYETKQPDGSKGRNTEIIGFKGNKVSSVEVYFGWPLYERKP